MYPVEHIFGQFLCLISCKHTFYGHLSRIRKLTRFTRFIRKVFATKILLSGKTSLFVTLYMPLFEQSKQWRQREHLETLIFLHLDLLLEELLVIFSDSEVEVNLRKRVPHLFTTSVHPLPVSALISFYWYFPSPLYLVHSSQRTKGNPALCASILSHTIFVKQFTRPNFQVNHFMHSKHGY